MSFKYKKIVTLALFSCISSDAFSQKIWIQTERYHQEFKGIGGAADNFLHVWQRQTDKARRKAVELVAKDIHLGWIKNYINERPENSSNSYDRFIRFFNEIKAENPDVKVQITVSDLPDEFEKVDDKNENKRRVDDSISNVYWRVANYYFDVLKGFHDRGLVVDELDLLNEPGGLHNAIPSGKLYSHSVNHLRNLINNSEFNKTGVVMPLIAGPSSWSVDGASKWIETWVDELPAAIENLDILTTHGYRDGWSSASYRALRDHLDLPFYNNEQTAKIQGDDPLSAQGFGDGAPEYIYGVSIAGRITAAINGGVNTFFLFRIAIPTDNNSALIRVGTSVMPEKSTIYSAVKQLTSLQPKNSHRISRVASNMDGSRVLSMRKKGDNKVYLHVTNVNDFSQALTIYLSDDGTNTRYIKAVKAIVSDQSRDEAEDFNESYSPSLKEFNYTIEPYSVNSLEIAFTANP